MSCFVIFFYFLILRRFQSHCVFVIDMGDKARLPAKKSGPRSAAAVVSLTERQEAVASSLHFIGMIVFFFRPRARFICGLKDA